MDHRIVDTHIHVWNFDKANYSWLNNDTSILNRTYSIAEIEEERKSVGVTGGVLVQAANNLEDTNWMLELAEETSWITGVVGWLPLMDPVKTEQLLQDSYLQNKYFKGVRHLIHNEPDVDWMLQDTVIESLNVLAKYDLTYDLVGILNDHIETALKVAEKVPELKMVFDHLNQPPIASKEKFGYWGKLMKEAAANSNFYAKISGLGTTSQNFAGWAAADIEPYLAFTLEQFGTNRCFCGGDWPVSLLAGSYSKTWNAYKEVLAKLLIEADEQKVLMSNAIKFYKLHDQLS